MAEDRDPDDDRGAPSLEPPSLFGRKKGRKRPAPPPVEPALPPEPDDSPTTIFDEPEPLVPEPSVPEPSVTEPLVSDPLVPEPLEPEPEPVPVATTPRAPREPWLLGRPAAVLTGLLVGALIVAGAAGSQRLCTEVKGTSSCGNSGFFLLVAILVVAVLVGAALLRAARVPQPGSTSFLAVGLLSVVTLLFLVGQLFEWWMVIVIPLVSVATFLLSHWVTTTYIEPEADPSAVTDDGRQPESYDVR